MDYKVGENKPKVLLPEEKQMVVASLEQKTATAKSINEKIAADNVNIQEKWEPGDYEDHKKRFEADYYELWKVNEQNEYKAELDKIEQVKVQGALEGNYEQQLQPGDRYFWISRYYEKKAINKYKTGHEIKNLNFDKNTVREMNALDKYHEYHSNYFASRNHQRETYNTYLRNAPKVSDDFQEKWEENIKAQKSKFEKFFRTHKGPLMEVKESVLTGLFSPVEEKRVMSRKKEMDVGLRAFFTMTKKTLFWKKQVGLLGIESEEERKDGSEYNKKLLRRYTKGTSVDRVNLMDELAKKLLKFKLTPNMFTNKYMAKNMLQMQRYSDMLTGFVELTKCNPNYLDITNSKVAHTSPEMAALVRSRIILMQAVIGNFMEKHAKYYGYKKEKGVEGQNKIDYMPSEFANEDQHNTFARETWNMVKAAYNSTVEFVDEMADVRMESELTRKEAEANARRTFRNRERQNTDLDDSKFKIKYDVDGVYAEKLVSIRNKITSNPYIYELFGSDLDKLFKKINEMTRRLDEVSTRSSLIKDLLRHAGDVGYKQFELDKMWKTYLQKEDARVTAESNIITKQLTNYEKAVDYFVGQKLDDQKFKLTDASEDVKTVIKLEGLYHVFELEKAFKYNDLLYKNLDFYDFDKYTNFTGKDGKVVEIKDLWTQYNFTLLKRGMDRARTVNEMAGGQVQIEINDPKMLNNIERRKICKQKFTEAEAKAENYKWSLAKIHNTDISEMIDKFKLTGNLDITDDDAYVKYFEVKSIADIGKALEDDPTGKTVEGFDKLSEGQQDEIKIRTKLFMDYFKHWEGQMLYTRSEAYDFIGDIADMEGNNPIVEGIDKQYRASSLKMISDKLNTQWEGEKNDEDKKMISELCDFMYGMAIANDYKAKAFDNFCKDAYDAYKAEYLDKKFRAHVKAVFEEDYKKMVKSGLLVDTPEEKEKYLKRIDTTVSLRIQFDNYKKLSKEDKNILAVDRSWSKEEKGNYLSGNYNRFLQIMKKVNEDYCSDKNLLENMTQVLTEINYCVDFIRLLKANNNEYFGILRDKAGIGAKEGMQLDTYEGVVLNMFELSNAVLADYGIRYTGQILDRVFLKRELVRNDPKYAEEFRAAERQRDEALKTGVVQMKKEEGINDEIEELKKRYKEEIGGNLADDKSAMEFGVLPKAHKQQYEVKGKVIEGKAVSVNAKKIEYIKKYEALLAQRKSFGLYDESVDDSFEVINRPWISLPDEKVALEENLEGGQKIDYIKKIKEYRISQIRLLTKEHKPLEKARNFVDELFKYLHKNFKDTELMDHESVIKALKKAKDAWFFQLSADARLEAMLRLSKYVNDTTVMNDYFIWKNSQETNEYLAESAKIFEQDKYVKDNITTIRKIMDTIAEANASINDMQTPEFLDKLKENLDVKGIDERQFMFLLRKHNVGVSGLANNIKDADKALLNKQDVDRYLNVETKDDFLLETTREVLKAGEELKMENINEKYILDHFEDCYFTANRMVAFQQLYYGEMAFFNRLEYKDGEEGEIGAKVKKYFDKGHGEAYAMYYNTVMAVANKYGVSAQGTLSFGLSLEELGKLKKEGVSNKETSKKVADNIADAEKRIAGSVESIKQANKMTNMAMIVEEAMNNSMAVVEVEEKLQDNAGISRNDKKNMEKLKVFYSEHGQAFKGAQKFITNLKGYEDDKNKVAYTKRAFDYPQGMFFMAKEVSFRTGMDMIKNTPIAINFKNLFNRNDESVARNLSVLDEAKCNRVMKRMNALKLNGSGKIGVDEKGEKIASEAYFDKNFSVEFFEDMINAQNFCMMFEMNNDFLNLEGYESQYANAKEIKSGIKHTYNKYFKELQFAEKRREVHFRDFEWSQAMADKLQIDRDAAAKDGDKERAAKYDIRINELKAEHKHSAERYKHYDFIVDSDQIQMDTIKRHFVMRDEDVLTPGKLTSMRNLSKMFSSRLNRFVISTYVDLFMAYLMKNGIKIDGSFANSEVYDDILKNRMVYNENDEKTGASISKKEALEVGDNATASLKDVYEKAYNMKLEAITKGKYLYEYDAMHTKENILKNEEIKKIKEEEKKAKEAEKKPKEDEKQKVEAPKEEEKKEVEAPKEEKKVEVQKEEQKVEVQKEQQEKKAKALKEQKEQQEKKETALKEEKEKKAKPEQKATAKKKGKKGSKKKEDPSNYFSMFGRY